MNIAQIIALMSMATDVGWKIISEQTKNMTEAELDAFIANKETNIATIEADLKNLYGQP